MGLAQFPRSQWRLWRVCRDARRPAPKLTYPGFGSDAVQAVLRRYAVSSQRNCDPEMQ